MSKKQDRQGVRTPAALEQKYNFAKTENETTEARRAAAEARSAAAQAQAAVNAITLPADYIYERGKSGAWTYEKWVSGKAVCWCTTEEIAVTNATPTVSYAFPTDLFISAPSFVLVNSISGYVGISGITASEVGFYISVAVSANVKFMIEAKGEWKGENT